MFCTNCGNKTIEDSVFCNNCGAKLFVPVVERTLKTSNSSHFSTKTKEPIPKQRQGLGILGILTGTAVAIIGLVIIVNIGTSIMSSIGDWLAGEPVGASGGQFAQHSTQTAPANRTLTFGDTFVFNDLEITFWMDYDFVRVNNMFHPQFGNDIVRLPITVRNLRNESHRLNPLNVTVFGPDDVGIMMLFDDFYGNFADLTNVGALNLRSGVSRDMFIYFPFNGDGDYWTEFTLLQREAEVRLPLSRH